MSEFHEPRSFDAPGALLARLALHHPRLAYPLAGALGSLRNRLTRRWPRTADVQALFPHLSRSRAGAVAARIGALHELDRVLVRVVLRNGIEPVRPLVSISPRLAALRGPQILGMFHVGALNALGGALEQLGSPVLAFRHGKLYEPLPPLQLRSTHGSERKRARALHEAVVTLRTGGMVALALDAVPGEGSDVICLGRTLRIAPGAFALARWTGAPILPITARWSGHRVEVDVGDAVATPAEAAAWLERYLVGSPSELSLGLLRLLLGVS